MPWRGLEPRRLSAPPPQDGVSTNFTTRARRTRDDLPFSISTEPTGLEPATSRVTVECSNQTELRLPARQGFQNGHSHRPSPSPVDPTLNIPAVSVGGSPAPSTRSFDSPYGNRTRLCTVKGCRPNR